MLTTQETTVITRENVKALSELIALKALKTVASYSHGKLDYLYRGLILDIRFQNNPEHVFTNGYDFVQTAAAFLCEYIGHQLGDFVQTAKGEIITIKKACFRYVDKSIRKTRKDMDMTMEIVENLDSLLTTELIQEEPDYTKYDKILGALRLKPVEMNVLDCLMSNMSYSETARFLNVNFTTVWRRRNRIRYKYLSITNI